LRACSFSSVIPVVIEKIALVIREIIGGVSCLCNYNNVAGFFLRMSLKFVCGA
jgi:hypothetical protein